MADREIDESEITQFILDTLDGDLTTTLAAMALIVGLCRNDELGVRLLEEVYEIRESWIDQAQGVKH
mgnify:CR=1 FL=1